VLLTRYAQFFKMKFLLIIIFCIYIIGCQRVSLKTNQGEAEIAIEEDNILGSLMKDDSLNEDYFGFDTLFIKQYITDNNNEIKLEGSKSKDIYRIVAKNKNGLIKKFQIANNWYSASHSSILWDNEDFIFIRYGCGTSCWGAKVLSLNDNRGILNFPMYFYSDSVRNIVIFPDTIEPEKILIENLNSQRSIDLELKLCDKSAIPILMIDSVYFDNLNNINILYQGSDCKSLTKVLNINQIKN